MCTKKVALGMSGGVDSSVSAVLLQEAGYEVTGVYLECWKAPGCRAEEDRKDALAVALKLGIPFQVLDFKEAYRQKVVEYFFDTYKAGRTPNPDVLCNKEIKFGLFYDWALRPPAGGSGKPGFDFVATGHYAQISNCQSNFDVPASSVGGLDSRKRGPAARDQNTTCQLLQSKDSWKDQTYFLYRLRQDQLSHILFPIGHLTKKEVRSLATSYSLLTADKPDSQGICFIGEINVHNFLRDRLGENPGDVVDTSGKVIGRHKGLWFYTIGQRHGFDVPVQGTAIPPFYVIAKNPEKNQLVVGFGAQAYKNTFMVSDLHWIADSMPLATNDSLLSTLTVRIRHTGKLIRCTLDGSTVKLQEQIQGIAPGQSAVFYDGDVCLGGGTID